MPAPPARADDFLAFSDEQLRIMQRKISKSFPGGQISEDPILLYYLAGLNARFDNSERTYIAVNDAKSVNAFAIWSNAIVIYNGLIALCQSEAELAGVMAHERAHVDSRHLARLADQTGLMSSLTTIGMLVALFTQSQDAMEIFAGAQSLQRSAQYSIQRDLEREADQQAIVFMSRAGYEVEGYLRALQRIHDSSGGGSPPEYMSTHPISTNRIAEVRSYIRNQAERSGNRRRQAEADELSFLLVRERARFRSHITSGKQVDSPYAAVAEAYGKLLLRSIEPADALEILLPYADNWIIAYELSELYMAAGDVGSAVDVLENARAKDPENIPLLAKLLSILGRTGSEQAARRLLRLMPAELRLEPAIIDAEIRLWYELNDQLRYRVAIAHSKFAQGKLDGLENEIKQIQASMADQPPSAAVGRLELLAGKLANLEHLLEQS